MPTALYTSTDHQIWACRMRDDKVKTHLVLPKKHLSGMDRFLSPRGRSQFVAEAAREKPEGSGSPRRLRMRPALGRTRTIPSSGRRLTFDGTLGACVFRQAVACPGGSMADYLLDSGVIISPLAW